MKPRISLDIRHPLYRPRSITWQWYKCIGGDVVGFGYSPKSAYDSWLYYCNMRRKRECN